MLISTIYDWCVDGFRKLQGQSLVDALSTVGPWGWFFRVAGGLFISIPLYYAVRYRTLIRKRVEEVERQLARGLIYRDPGRGGANNKSSRNKSVRALELHPPFVEKSRAEGWNLMSLGQYLSTLRINQLDRDEDKDDDSIPKLLKKELEATIGAVLLRNLGPRLGAVVLPMLGISKIDSWIGKVAASIASYITSHIMAEFSSDWDPTEDRAAFPLAVSEIVAFANLNQKMRSDSPNKKKPEETAASEEVATTSTSSLDWMNLGEIGYTPSYSAIDDESLDESKKSNDESSTATTELIPNPFVVERHFEAAILGMEDRIRSQSTVSATNPTPNAEPMTTTAAYDPDDKSLPKPVPINEGVLPGLHMGWGDAKCTHTKRGILRNRLLAVIMTRLSYNYHIVEKEQKRGNAGDELFTVEYKGTRCRFPDEFVQALVSLLY
jgi:hypothetical protein